MTIIIHNAWKLDFNLSLSSFEPHIRSTRNLVDLALRSPQPAQVRFLFMSSIASARSWNPHEGEVPESLSLGPNAAAGSGYGASKFVAEQVNLDYFAIYPTH